MRSSMFECRTVRVLLCTLILYSVPVECNKYGPDPWDMDKTLPLKVDDHSIPPDLKLSLKPKEFAIANAGMCDWFFRRILAILLKGGQSNIQEDGSVDISVALRFDKERWQILNEYLSSKKAFTDDTYRRSVGFIEEAIYKPTIVETIVLAWTDYIQIYLIEYKEYLTWSLGILGTAGIAVWLWSHMSHRHIVISIFILLYLYEVFVSYKEAEQKELDRFISAMNTCKWYFWSSQCEAPPPDILIFIKHMNPLKIALRMFTTLISEPMISLSAAINTMIHGIADELWFPFDKIVYGFLIIIFNVLLMFLLVLILFHYIFNFPFKLGILGISLGVGQRNRSFLPNSEPQQSDRMTETGDRISGTTLNRMFDVFSQALTHNAQNQRTRLPLASSGTPIRRSASTGRLPSSSSAFEDNNNRPPIEYKIRRRGNNAFNLGGGDA